jgi:hypothetical protein
MSDSTLKRRDLNSSHGLGCVVRHNCKPRTGSRGHVGVTSPVQTLKKTEDQSERKREESGRGEDGGVYDVCM